MHDVANIGVPFHGEFTSADASALDETNSRMSLYGPGSVTAVTLDSNDQVIITDLKVIAGSALTVTIYDGGNTTVAAGERIDLSNFGANGGVFEGMTTPHYCQKGTYPKVKTSGAGQIDVQIRGRIRRIGS